LKYVLTHYSRNKVDACFSGESRTGPDVVLTDPPVAKKRKHVSFSEKLDKAEEKHDESEHEDAPLDAGYSSD
jgi:hypothetical protein